MKRAFGVVVALGGLVACGDDEAMIDAGVADAEVDAAELDAAELDAVPVDAPIDAIELDACAPQVLLAGGQDIAAQGWTMTQIQPSMLTYNGGQTLIATTTAAGANSGGQLMLMRAGTFAVGTAATVDIVLRLDAVARHNQFDAAAAILVAFTPAVGQPVERAQMIYLDANAIGFADDTATHAVALTDGNAHTFRVHWDGVAGITVAVDGVAALSRTGLANVGMLAIGDQTNDARVDSTMRIESVTLLCP